jgi:hypothetical protein
MKDLYGTFSSDTTEKHKIPEGYIFVVTTFEIWRYTPTWWTEFLLHFNWRRVKKKKDIKWNDKIFKKFQELFLWDNKLWQIIVRGILDNYYNISDRAVGYYKTFEDAEEAVMNNHGDLCEAGTNAYVVIEATSEGMYADVIEVQWYYWVWSGRYGYYMKSGRPDKVVHVSRHPGISEHFKGICNLGIG